jgi:hypothetical protein
MINNDQIISVREVFKELENQGFIEWANRYKEIFKIPTSDETKFIIKIFESAHFRSNLIEPKKIGDYKQIADPFLISKAHSLKGCVVTEENKRPNSGKIPNVCEAFNIKCTNLKGFMEENNIRF